MLHYIVSVFFLYVCDPLVVIEFLYEKAGFNTFRYQCQYVQVWIKICKSIFYSIKKEFLKTINKTLDEQCTIQFEIFLRECDFPGKCAVVLLFLPGKSIVTTAWQVY